MEKVLLAVNGTLMRGQSTHHVMRDAAARFLREDMTESTYRLWSIGDKHPAMVRVTEGGRSIAVEVYELGAAGFVEVLLNEPVGLSVGHVRLSSGERLLGVVGEPVLCEGEREITEFGGWRAYLASRS